MRKCAGSVLQKPCAMPHVHLPHPHLPHHHPDVVRDRIKQGKYTPQQAALLAAIGSFVAKNHQKVLIAAVLGACNATCTALADEPDITHSDFNPAVQFGAVGGLAFNASNAVVRCHLGDDEQCAIAFASYNASAPPAGLNCVGGGSGVMDQKLCAFLGVVPSFAVYWDGANPTPVPMEPLPSGHAAELVHSFAPGAQLAANVTREPVRVLSASGETPLLEQMQTMFAAFYPDAPADAAGQFADALVAALGERRLLTMTPQGVCVV